MHALIGLVDTVWRSALCQSKNGGRRLRQGKPVPCPLFASGTSVVRVQRLVKLRPGVWYTCCLNPVDVLSPVGAVLGEFTATVNTEGLLLLVTLTEEQEQMLSKLQNGFEWPHMPADAAPLLGPEPKAVAPVRAEGWSVHHFCRSQQGYKNIEAFLLEVPRRFAKQGMTILNTKTEIRIKIHGKTVHMNWSILAARAPDYFCVVLSEKNGRDFSQTVLSKFVGLVPNGSEDKTALAARLSDLRVFVGHVNAISAPFIPG